MAINREDWLRSVVPSGTVIAFAGTTAPSGWLLCDGSAISRSTYSALFTAIGSAHGSGDGSTTFHLPDYRGRFLRGLANGSVNDPDRANRTHPVTGAVVGDTIGSVQDDAMQGHGHRTYGSVINVGSSASYSVGIGQGATATNGLRSSSNIAWSDNSTQEAITLTSGTPKTTSESRPKNANVNYIIKA